MSSQNPIDQDEVRQQREQVFRQRAELLAVPPEAGETPGQQDSIMTFRLGEARYGIPLADVAEVISNALFAIVPGAPSEVAGVIQLRGEIRPVYHLSRILGLSDGGEATAGTVMLLRHAGREFGIRVTSVDDILVVAAANRLPPPAGMPHAAWITKDLVTVLDTAGLRKGKPQ